MSVEITEDAIEQTIREIVEALLKIGTGSCPTLYLDEFRLLVDEAVRRISLVMEPTGCGVAN
jgi:hypothetical protein